MPAKPDIDRSWTPRSAPSWLRTPRRPAWSQSEWSSRSKSSRTLTDLERLGLRRLWLKVQAGVREEGVDQPGPVLDPLEPVLHDRGELVDAMHDQVSQV